MQIIFTFFLDHFCSNPDFTLYVSGRYIKAGKSPIVPGGFDLDFYLESGALTTNSKQMTEEMNNRSSCGKKTWVVGGTQELSKSGGCPEIGLSLPTLDLDLAMIEKGKKRNYLYLAQPSSDKEGKHFSIRSTSYDARMVRCELHNNEITPMALAQISQNGASSAAIVSLSVIYKLLSIL